LWVKGSGGDLGTIKRDGFATLYMDRLNALKKQYRGVENEDEMVDRYPLCTFGNNPRAASIDTPLHAFLPAKHVDHLHPDWAIALAACANGPAVLKQLEEETGIKLVWLPWKRPGFELGLWLEQAARENPEIDGILLGSHGLFTWGDTGRESYLNTLRVLDKIGQFVLKRTEAKGTDLFGGAKFQPLAERAAVARTIMPVIRGEVGPAIGHFTDDQEVLRFVNSSRAKQLAYQGTSCPDHFVRTKVRPLYVEWDPQSGTPESLRESLLTSLESYRTDYAEYYEQNRVPSSPAIRSKNPTVVLIPGIGMFAFGKNKAEARTTSEFYINAIHVMEGATSFYDSAHGDSLSLLEPYIARFTPLAQRPTSLDNYVALPLNESFGIEYWLLEEAKLQRMPPEKELSRKVAVVVGASPGIGQEVANRLAREGAHVVVADIKPELAEQAAANVRAAYGKEVAISAQVDATDRASVKAMYDTVVKQFGGVDVVVSVAAIFFPSDSTGMITEDQWRKTFDVNLLASMLVADEGRNVMAAQNTEGSIVLISSANGVVPKKGSWAYDTSKAALNHLVREMAVTYAPKVRVNGVAPASVVEGSLQFPRERVISSLAKYDIAFDEGETTEQLRDRLSSFYSERTLLKKKVTPKLVAEAAFMLASNRLSLTTGQSLAVDAGLPEAFLR
jgi:rhamnose utilization protein RhaD (predicted bifunctional aldolase and dehydrogenase)/NAD(P)-dependent dehydrogenase (short-subunit alcohol dehydrogenase family)